MSNHFYSSEPAYLPIADMDASHGIANSNLCSLDLIFEIIESSVH